MVDKAKRWENVDLKAAALSKAELRQIKILLERRMASESSLSLPRLKAAVKRINALLNAPKPKAIKIHVEGNFVGAAPTGRFGGGSGQASFVSGGTPGSKK